jgi:hypothetical protein
VDGHYGYYYDTAAHAEDKSITKARRLSEEEAFDLAVQKLRRERRLSAKGVHDIVMGVAPLGPTMVGASLCALLWTVLGSKALRTYQSIHDPLLLQLVGVGLQYKTDVGDLNKQGVWDSFAADKDGWVPPAMLAAVREIQSITKSFPNLNRLRRRSQRERSRRKLQSAGIVKVHASDLDHLMCLHASTDPTAFSCPPPDH